MLNSIKSCWSFVRGTRTQNGLLCHLQVLKGGQSGECIIVEDSDSVAVQQQAAKMAPSRANALLLLDLKLAHAELLDFIGAENSVPNKGRERGSSSLE